MPVPETVSCAECGAVTPGGLSCWELFGHLLAQEQYNPELVAEHFLTVACYNLQHPAQLTPRAVEDLRQLVIDKLDHGLPTDFIRRRTSARFDGNTRVLLPEAERRPQLRRWTMTIADVSFPENPAGAAARVRTWAAAIRGQL